MTTLLAKDGEGERLDRFELIAELASGGMATVYLARLSGVAGFQRLVAIKRLHPHLAREAEFVEMFLDEARLAARIHHPNVVPIQEVGESDRGYYLVMDYVEGDTLARLLARAGQAKTKIPHGVIIRVLLDVFAGLHAAHELKDDAGEPLAIVHRDVSPQNVLVGVDGVARLVDFGVARAASRLSTTRSGQLKGKLAYMAPEQARGGSIDRRADVFAAGVVLWEALALKRLFRGEGEAETLNRVLYDPILPPSHFRADVPPSLEAVCMKALEREPENRYPTAQAFADELEGAARALASIGSVRDVAACLQEVIGPDLSQQRDAVRAWLAASEPSRSKRLSRPPPPPESVTRVEGGSQPAPKGRESAPPASDSERRGEPVALAAPARPTEPGEKVSSVSSAVIHAAQPASAEPRRSRAALVVGVALAAAVVTGGGVWGATQWSGGAASTGASTAPPREAPTPSRVATATAALPPSAATSAGPTASASAASAAASGLPSAATSAGPTASASAGAGPRSQLGGAGTSKRSPPRMPASSKPAAPDDLTNPYR